LIVFVLYILSGIIMGGKEVIMDMKKELCRRHQLEGNTADMDDGLRVRVRGWISEKVSSRAMISINDGGGKKEILKKKMLFWFEEDC